NKPFRITHHLFDQEVILKYGSLLLKETEASIDDGNLLLGVAVSYTDLTLPTTQHKCRSRRTP
ncbi:hypothetical protein, partial [Enterobacter asburiae]